MFGRSQDMRERMGEAINGARDAVKSLGGAIVLISIVALAVAVVALVIAARMKGAPS